MKRLTIHNVKARKWDDIHPDYKSIREGVKYALVMDEKGVTVSMIYKEAKQRNLV